MGRFIFVATLLFIWIIFLIISGGVMTFMLIKEIIDRRKEKKKMFDKAFPQWFIFRTMIRKQKFPYGKWKYLGKDVSGEHLFERVK